MGSSTRRSPPSSWAAAFRAAAAVSDEVDDGLRLGQVQPPVQKGPFRELPRPRLPHRGSGGGPGGEEGSQRFPQNHRGAVAVELGGVLPGVAVGTGEADRQPPVDHLPLSVQNLSQHHTPGLQRPEGPGRAENPVTHREAVRTGDADDPDGGRGPSSGGNGGDGIHRRLLSQSGGGLFSPPPVWFHPVHNRRTLSSGPYILWL